jgi:uncharacterized membrane protein (UPF0127 family)
MTSFVASTVQEAGVVWLLFLSLGAAAGQTPEVRAVMLGHTRLVVETATTAEAQGKGLAGRSSLDADLGMLFVYPKAMPLQFWMKGTKIPLSIAFLDEKGLVLNIEDMNPLEERYRYLSKGPALYALEVNRGWFARHGVKPGDRALFVWTSSQIDGVAVGGRKLVVETVTTPDKIERGLMYRDHLPEDHGMLFVFSRPHPLAFWMKNTKIPLSVAFLDTDRRIINLADMEPMDAKTHHRSKRPGLYALEVNRGWFARHGVKPGDPVMFLQRSKERIEAPGGGVR